ncbi:hypothetical protein GmHk_19G053945 [Glycine max]|nr:hypothetical protein GmHk_19G053945 [Glycine max]
MHLLGCTLFANKSVTHMHVVFLDALCDLTQSETYAWGAAVLVHMYDNLNEVLKSTTSGKALPVSTYHRRLDRLTLDIVCWISYGDHHSFREFEVICLFSDHLRWGPLTVIHRLERVVRNFGYIQTIPPHPIVPSVFVEEMDARWMQFGDYIAPLGDPPRVSPVQQYDTFVEPDVHQQPVAATTHDESNIHVHRPRHAVDGYVAIADKLERLLNLRILTEGTKAYTVAEECLSIARSYIGQPTVGHRSRRRWNTNGH